MKCLTFDAHVLQLSGTSACRELFEPIFLFRREEMLLAALVDEGCGLIELLAWPGTHDEVGADTSGLLRRAVEIAARGLIVAHNHPSGDPRPSASDKRWTRRLALQCEALGIALVDHLLFGGEGAVSMRGQGLL